MFLKFGNLKSCPEAIVSNKMTLNRVIVFVIFCTFKSKADDPRDLEFYYLNTVGTQSIEIIPQDGQDAQAIIDSKMDPNIVAKILLNREKIRRININKEIAKKDEKHPLLKDPFHYTTRDDPLNDLYFILTHDENTVMSVYLRNLFFYEFTEPWITIILVLTKDMVGMKKTYDDIYGWRAFNYAEDCQLDEFEDMIRVWDKQNREPNEKELNQDAIKKGVDALVEEYKNSGWEKNRDQIESTLMKKSIKYAREVIKGFEKAHDNCAMEQIINYSIYTHNLNPDLAFTYSALVVYVKNRHQFMADLMRKYSKGADCWIIWNLCITVTLPEEWIKIDQIFRNSGDKDVSLSKFIMEKSNIPDLRMFASMVSQIVDVTKKDPSKPPTNPPPTPAPPPPGTPSPP